MNRWIAEWLSGPPGTKAQPVQRRIWLLLVLPFGSAVFVLAVLAVMSGAAIPSTWSGASFEVESGAESMLIIVETIIGGFFGTALMVFNQLSSLLLMLVIVIIARYAPKGLPAVVLGSLVHTAVLVAMLLVTVTSDSSTSALDLLFIPFYLCALAALVAFASGATHQFRTR